MLSERAGSAETVVLGSHRIVGGGYGSEQVPRFERIQDGARPCLAVACEARALSAWRESAS